MVDLLIWLLTIELLGLLAFPLAFALFHRLPDRGYTVSKPLALILFSYALWILGLTQLIPNSRLTIIVILLLASLPAGFALRRNAGAIRAFLRNQRHLILVSELVFLADFLFWAWIISEAPAINHTEKPMDFGFLNAILQSEHFPPEDPWLAGHSISYYYFGHFMMAFLIKLTGITSSIGYNLAVASIPALAAVASLGLLYNLARLSGSKRNSALAFGLVAPVLLLLIGNLEGVMEWIRVQGWGSAAFWEWVGIKDLSGDAVAAAGAFPDQSWWWWRATRVIDTLGPDGESLDYTITEFPFFSFLLGDLHPHAMSLPFVTLNLSLALNLFQSSDRMGLNWLRQRKWEAGAIALCLGAASFINTWDFPLLALILGLAVLFKSYLAEGGNHLLMIKSTVLVLAPIVLTAVILFLPFYQDLSTQAQGIRLVGDYSARPFLFFLVMGLFLVLGSSFLLRQAPGLLRLHRQQFPLIAIVAAIIIAPFVLWAFIVLSGAALASALPDALLEPVEWALGSVGDGIGATLWRVTTRFWWILPGMLITGLAVYSALQRLQLGRLPVAAFPLLLLAVSFYLLVGIELFHVVDFFGNRMNTVFKVYYQSWLLLSIVGAYGIYYWHSRRSTEGRRPSWGYYAWAGMVSVLLIASLYYPVGATIDRTGVLTQNHTLADNTLDALAFLQRSAPGEYAAIAWLRDQAPPGVIVEAVGASYSEYGRISSSTGLPTILGWPGHEHQWRGSTSVFAGREDDVSRIYRSDDAAAVRQLLDKYGARYVYIGAREQRLYGNIEIEKFQGFMKTVFEQDGVVILERTDIETTNH